MDLNQYRARENEKLRAEDLMRILPKHRSTVLEIGARDGHFSRLLTEHFSRVTALDLQRPTWTIDGVETVAGNVEQLDFADDAFDCSFCTEVLEHVPKVEQAARELLRVTRHEIVVGVPCMQDTRVGRTTCPSCGRPNPPYGHINTFDEQRLRDLFTGAEVLDRSFVGERDDATTDLATWLMDRAGNPWGTYMQDEPCIHCGAEITDPGGRTLGQKVCAKLAHTLNTLQRPFARRRARWIHLVFRKHA